MRVVQLVTQDRGGPVDHAVEVAAELARTGHESHLVGPPCERLRSAAERGVRVHVAEVTSKTDLAGAREVAAVVRRLRPDLLHLQDRRAGLVGRVIAAQAAIPAVYTLHGVPDQLASLVPGNLAVAPARGRDRLAYLRLERLLASGPRTAVVTPCEALTDYVTTHVGIRPERVHTVYNGVARELLAEEPRPVPAGEHLGALWLGLMEPVKRVGDLVAAAAPLPQVRLTLVGDGPERGRIAAAVASAGSAARVSFAGFQADPTPYLRAAEVFVLCSAAEACPMALLQAMACGTPVVATRVGGIPEIVRHGVDGFLVDPGQPDQLGAALGWLAADVPLRRAMSLSARSRAVERFGIERTVVDLLDVYARTARCGS